jgi:hypothetical protein
MAEVRTDWINVNENDLKPPFNLETKQFIEQPRSAIEFHLPQITSKERPNSLVICSQGELVYNLFWKNGGENTHLVEIKSGSLYGGDNELFPQELPVTHTYPFGRWNGLNRYAAFYAILLDPSLHQELVFRAENFSDPAKEKLAVKLNTYNTDGEFLFGDNVRNITYRARGWKPNDIEDVKYLK